MKIEKASMTDEQFVEWSRILAQGNDDEYPLSNEQMIAVFQRYVDTNTMPDDQHYHWVAQYLTEDGNLTGYKGAK